MEQSGRDNIERITIAGIGANGSKIYNDFEPYLSNMGRFLQRVDSGKRQEAKRQLLMAFLSGVVVAILMTAVVR